MLAEGGNREKKETPHSDDDLFGPKVLFILAVATSIDALAAGLTLPMLGAPMGLSLATIGLTTAVLSAIGLFAGRLFGASLGRRLDFAGGVVLIGLGIKILVQHLRGA
jgi:putative Mn2+ efflux pump MntP